MKVQSLDPISAGGDGIVATSKAFAKAELEQKAEQDNDSEMSAVVTPSDSEQSQSLSQFNLNAQIGFANSEAYSDYVEVGQSGPLEAGGTGIIATSEAVALADLDQKVEQDNENEMSATPGGFQEQSVEQTNVNLQFGVANAEAYAGEVKVRNLEDPAHEDGIDAESKAVAVAKLEQNVDQDNENKSAGGGRFQSVNQANNSEQIASPEHELVSMPTVSQGTAPVEQTTAPADQTTAPTEPVVKGGQPVTQGPDPVEPSDPPSGQNPPADPTTQPASVADPAAPVDPTAPVELGVAPVDLTTPEQAPQQAEVPSDPASTPLEQLAGPGQGPVGMSGQDQAGFGGANAEAYSDDVLVEKNGKLSVDGDGIDAEFEGGRHCQGRARGRTEERKQPGSDSRRGKQQHHN